MTRPNLIPRHQYNKDLVKFKSDKEQRGREIRKVQVLNEGQGGCRIKSHITKLPLPWLHEMQSWRDQEKCHRTLSRGSDISS